MHMWSAPPARLYPYMHAALRSAPPVPPSPSPRPEIDVWFQTAGPSTVVKYIYICE